MSKAATKPKASTRADKGAKHSPGAGRPAGTKRPRVQDAGLVTRMKKLDKLFSSNETVIKAGGIAGLAKVPGPDLTKMRANKVPLTEDKVKALEDATAQFLRDLATALGYQISLK